MRCIDYINLVRVNHAKELLSDPTLYIKQVAHRVGLRNVTYFSREFRKFVGASPSNYRKALAQQISFSDVNFAKIVLRMQK